MRSQKAFDLFGTAFGEVAHSGSTFRLWSAGGEQARCRAYRVSLSVKNKKEDIENVKGADKAF